MPDQQRPAFITCVGALLASALAPALAVSVFFEFHPISGVVAFAFAVALGHAVILGIPLFLFIHRRGFFNFCSALGGGFLIGFLPLGILSFPVSLSGGSSSIGTVPMVVDGFPTYAGWMGYLETIFAAGAFGCLGGLFFWLVVRIAEMKPAKA